MCDTHGYARMRTHIKSITNKKQKQQQASDSNKQINKDKTRTNKQTNKQTMATGKKHRCNNSWRKPYKLSPAQKYWITNVGSLQLFYESNFPLINVIFLMM